MNRRITNYRRRIAWIVIVAMQHAAIAPALAAPLPVPTPNTGTVINQSAGGTLGTVNQTATKQVFNWNSFDINNGYKVIFNQPNSGAALNRIHDSKPSEIRGALQSVTPDGKGGAIYLINQNGIIFGSTAQVNVGSLVASQLNISDSNFENYSLSEIMGKLGQPAFEVFTDDKGKSILHDITIESGALIHSNGLDGVKIFAANISNAGTIETPDGQAILAASKDKVYLTAASTPSSVTPQLAGFLVEVDTGGNVSNVGHIIAERGDITLMGMAINQSGRLTATTAAGQSGNGSIRLLARDNAHAVPTQNTQVYDGNHLAASGPLVSVLQSDSNHAYVGESQACNAAACTGTVTFGKNSVTEVLPDDSSTAQPNSVAQNPSVVEVVGKNIELQDNALIHATGGVVQVTATSHPEAPQAGADAGSSIAIGNNARIDVSGASVDKSIQDSVVAAKLVGTNLADVPVQQGDVLNRADVMVDARLGTKVANVQGEIDAMTYSASERMTTGGSVNIMSGGAVTIDPNATLDVSGGKISYAGGDKTTTYVHGGGGWKEISQADPTVYYNNVKNITVHNAPGYVDGKNAGSVVISTDTAPALAVNVIKGSVTTGVYQRDISAAPKAGTLTLNLQNGLGGASTNTVNIVTQQAYQNSTGQITDQLFASSGLSDFIINTGGDVNVAKGADVHLVDGGKFAVNTTTTNNRATAINIDGTIHIAGGSVALHNQDRSGQIKNTLTLGASANIDTSGRWINEFLDAKTITSHFIDGGSIDLQSGSLFLQQGSKLISNGGALYDSTKKLTAGSGGTIALATNYATATPANTLDAAQLQLGSTLSAYSLSQGGSLSLTHNGFVIGNSGTAVAARDLLLTPDYFRQGGFSDYSLTSTLDGIRVVQNTRVDLRGQNWQVADRALFAQRTGADLSRFVAITTLPDYLRKPVDLNLTVDAQPTAVESLVGVPTLSVETGASINGDPGANIALNSQALQILIDGTIKALGGNIDVTLAGASGDSTKHNYKDGYSANQAIVLGSNAELDTSATFVAKPQINHSTFRDYLTYDAGKISLNAKNGYLVAESGSQLRVDGAAQQMDVRQYSSNSRATQLSTSVAASAGTLHLQAAEGMLLDANLSGKAVNVAGARGGRLEIVLDTSTAGATRLDALSLDKPSASTIHLTQVPVDGVPLGLVSRSGAGQISGVNDIRAALAASPANLANNAVYLSADKIGAGGFDSLQLGAANTPLYDDTQSAVLQKLLGSISIDSDVSLALRQSVELNANTISVNNGSNAKLSAGYLAWGRDASAGNYNQSYEPFAKAPTSGGGTLTLAGNFIDLIGNLTTTGTKQTTLQSSGDIRARDILNNDTTTVLATGSLTTAGNLTLQAQQIYPPSAHHFSFNVQSSDPGAELTILPQAGTPNSLLSAGGSLVFNAPNIEQDGTVKAPLGSITLNATNNLTLGAGSDTSIALDTLVPYGVIDPQTGKWQIPLPQKNIELQAPNLTVANGAVVDISGGGDVFEYQFIAGPGGSKDVLANPGSSFAIVPTLSLAYAPLDTLDASMQAANGWSPGQVVSLDIDGSVKTYAVLPSRYAMLPGAMLVTPNAQYAGLAPGSSFTLTDGTQIVAGKMGYTPQGGNNTPLLQDSLWSAFALQTNAQIFDRSEYHLQYGSGLSTDTSTSNLPQDAGSLQILAQTSAVFAGELRAAGADGGHGGKLDIQADAISVVKTPSAMPHSGLELVDSQLNGMSSVESIFLGGTRQSTDSGTQLSVAAKTVSFAANVALNVQELLVAAKDKIAIAANAIVSASGARNPSSDAETLNVSGDGAILRLSSVDQAAIQRTGTSAAPTQGSITVADSAQLHASKAIAVDVTQGANLAGVMDVNGGSLAFSAPQISIGGGSNGLLLSADQLRSGGDPSHPDLQQLILNSSSNLDFYAGLSVSADDLQISAANLRSFVNATDVVALTANKTLTLSGGRNASAGSSGDNGQLLITAPQIVLNGGNASQKTLALNNFNNKTAINASGSVIAQNKLDLDVGGSATIVTPLLTIADGAALTVQSSNAVAITGGTGTSDAAGGTFGAVTVDARSAQIDTAVVLPSGTFTVNATGSAGAASDDLVIGDHAIIDVAGRTLTIGDQAVETDGGAINFTAVNGSVVATANSKLDVSAGGDNTDAGSININVASGNAQIDAQLAGTAAANHNGASFALDANSIGGLSDLLSRLNHEGFSNSIALRQRSGDLTLGAQDSVTAHNIDIEADSGALNVASTLDASDSDGGSVLLAAGADLNVLGTAKIDAHATGVSGNGGAVTLVSKNGYMALQDGSTIVVGGNGDGNNGSVTLQVSRTKDGVIAQAANDGTGDDGANGLAITHFDAQISGANTIDLVGVRHYLADKVSDVIVPITQQAVDIFGSPVFDENGNPVMQVVGWQGIPDDTTAFMARTGAWAQQLFGNNAPSNVRVMPGVDIYSHGDLTVDEMIDLYDNNSGLWRYGSNSNVPGMLSLRAAGNVIVNNPVSDGYIVFLGVNNTAVNGLYGDLGCALQFNCSGLATGASWNLNLVAGADIGSASPLATARNATGDLVLGAEQLNVANPYYFGFPGEQSSIALPTVIRTGTGNIHVAAAGNIDFQDNKAAIYTAGVITPFAQPTGATAEATQGYTYDVLTGLFPASDPSLPSPLPEFPIGGGNVSVRAGGDISVAGVTKPNQSSDWLLRSGDETYPVAWGIAPSLFGGGIGALAGGNVTVSAGNNINYVQIAAPTIGKQVGQIIDANGELKTDAVSQIAVLGGGNVAVNAGGDIASSSILVARGKGTIDAGGGLTQAQGAQVANLIGIGDAQVSIKAHGSIVTDAIYNPTAFFQRDGTANITEFLTYSAASRVNLFAATGDVVFNNDIQNLGTIYTTWTAQNAPGVTAATFYSGIMPATVAATAATGSIVLGNNMTLLPDAQSDLSLIAGTDISGVGNSTVNILLPDIGTSTLPLLSAANAAGLRTLDASGGTDNAASNAQISLANAHAEQPLHTNDTQPIRLSAGRDIINLGLNLPKAADIVAGRDIVNNTIAIQNLHPSDVSQVVAGRDLLLTGSNGLKISVSGPGSLDILAGRDVDLGNSVAGVSSVGNINNPALGTDPAASISVLAGLGSAGLNYDGFIQQYILGTDALLSYVTSSRFGGDVISYITAVTSANYSDRSTAITALENLANSGADGKAQAVSISQNIYLAATRAQQRELVLNTYFNELEQGGIEAQQKTGEGIARSYRAIDTLFPDASAATQAKQSVLNAGTGYAGDIRLTQSVIQGFGAGNINLIAPGGSIDVGLPVATQLTDQSVVQGIVIGGKGSINAYVRDNIDVNRSRIIVQDGGDILGFARFGNIDAGRGSRTKLTLPPPQLAQDPFGNLVLVSAAALSGSGIQAGCTSADCKGGTVYLFAPNGIIDAGDAGITSQGNIFLLANQIVHADVINATGNVTGAPAAPTPDIGLGGGDVAASAVQSAQELAASAASGGDQSPLGQRGLALLTVDILGYGSSQDQCDDDKCRRH